MWKDKIAFFLFVLLMIPICSFARFQKSFRANDRVQQAIIEGNYKQAIRLLKQSIQNDSLNAKNYFYLGYCYQKSFKYDSSAYFLEKAAGIRPDDPKIWIALGNGYQNLGRPRDAIRAFTEALRIDSNSVVAGIRLGDLYMEEQRYPEADSLYKLLFSGDSTNSLLAKKLGLCAEYMDSLDKSICYFKKTLEVNPYDTQAILHLGKLYYHKDQLDSALTIVDHGLEHYPDQQRLLQRKAEILFKMKQYEAAIPYFENIVKSGRATSLTYKKLGMCYYFLQNTGMALRNLLESYKKNDKDPITCFYIGLSYQDRNLYNKAILFLKRAIKLATPDYLSEFYMYLGSCQDHERQFVDAIRSYRKALSYRPGQRVLFFYLAAVYDQYYKDREVAYLYYQKFLRESDEADEKRIDYAKARLKELKQAIHFHRKPAKAKNNTNLY